MPPLTRLHAVRPPDDTPTSPELHAAGVEDRSAVEVATMAEAVAATTEQGFDPKQVGTSTTRPTVLATPETRPVRHPGGAGAWGAIRDFSHLAGSAGTMGGKHGEMTPGAQTPQGTQTAPVFGLNTFRLQPEPWDSEAYVHLVREAPE